MEPFLGNCIGLLVVVCALLESQFFAIDCYSLLVGAMKRYGTLFIVNPATENARIDFKKGSNGKRKKITFLLVIRCSHLPK